MECLRRINEQTMRRDAITTPLGGTKLGVARSLRRATPN